MPEFFDSKKLEIQNRIDNWDLDGEETALSFTTNFSEDTPTMNFEDLYLTQEEAESLMWDTHGRWVFPGDPQYEELRKIYYSNFKNIKPSMIAICQTVWDVRSFLDYIRSAREKNSEFQFTPRSGGHSTAGYSTVEGGVMLDLRKLNNMMVDIEQNLIHVGPGVQFRDFYRTLHLYNRFTPAGICPDVRVGGFMQGGGYGFGSRMFGMNCDNVTNLIVVLANGRVVQANRNVNADLFWAMRGGTGNNFGIVTQVTYKTYQVPQFGAIAMRWRINTDHEAEQGAKAMDLMQRQFMGSNSDQRLGYMAFINFQLEEEKKIPYLLMRTMYTGPHGLGSELLKELIATPGCEVEWEDTGPYPVLNNRLMGYGKFKNDTQFNSDSIKSKDDIPSQEKQTRFFDRQLGLEGWKKVIDHLRSAASQFQYLPELNIEPGGAAIDRTKRGDNAFIHRNDDFNAFLNTYWKHEEEKKKAFKFLENWLKIIEPWTNQEAYQNYPKSYVTDWSRRYWAEYYPCLCLIKKKYDPNNLFRFEQGIGADGNCPGNSMEEVKSLLPELAEQLEKPIEYI